MVSNYKILRKARLLDDLFVSDADEAALVQEEADRDWAREQDRDALGEIVGAAPAQPVAVPVKVPAAPGDAEAAEEDSSAPSTPVVTAKALVRQVAAEQDWTQILAELTGNPNVEGIRCLGVCGLDRHSGAGTAAAALARWASQNAKHPALLVEAHFREPRQAAHFGAREAGVSEALLRGASLDGVIQESGEENLELLTCGAPLGFFSRSRAVSAFPALFVSLREQYETIIVELPAANDPVLRKLPVASLVDAVILVADPKSAKPRDLRRAADQLRESRAPLAAAMFSSTAAPAMSVSTETLGRTPGEFETDE